MKRWFLPALAVLFMSALNPGTAFAQRPLQRLLDLNRQAMDAYTNLEVDDAKVKLEEAISVAETGNVRGAPLARTYLNLGVVFVGGYGDNAQGLQYFMQALEIDTNAQLDPLTSTPDIQTVFNLAKSRVDSTNRTQEPDGNNRGRNTRPPPPQSEVPGTLNHTPAAEQLAQTALPVYVTGTQDASSVYLYYKSTGNRDFTRVQMTPIAEGFGFEIPCADVFAPHVQYYIAAFGADGAPVGFAGTQQSPVTVPVVTARTGPPPALPGRSPPETCAEQECPPGMAGCSSGGGGTHGLGDTCAQSSECVSGLTCTDNFCMAAGDGQGDEPDGPSSSDAPRFFLDLGFAGSFSYADSGMLADSPRPPTPAGVDAGDWAANSPWENCRADYDEDSIPESECDVRIKTAGFVPTFAFRFEFGYYFLPRLGISAMVRFQPLHGEGNFANLMIGGRLNFLVTAPRETGFQISLHAGGSVGQIQSQPPQNGDVGPFIISGLAGAQVGGKFTYRFVRYFGLYLKPELNFLFPTFLFDADVEAGVAVSF